LVGFGIGSLVGLGTGSFVGLGTGTFVGLGTGSFVGLGTGCCVGVSVTPRAATARQRRPKRCRMVRAGPAPGVMNDDERKLLREVPAWQRRRGSGLS
jgi:hypothetical protein